MARLVLGGLNEETAFVERLRCGLRRRHHPWPLRLAGLRAHDLSFLYDSNEVCLCAERGCTSARRVRLDLTLDAPASPATRLSPAEVPALLGTVGLGEVPMLGRPSIWCPPGRDSAAVAGLATAAWAAGPRICWPASLTPAQRYPTHGAAHRPHCLHLEPWYTRIHI